MRDPDLHQDPGPLPDPDRDTAHASFALGLALTGDTALYLLLPMYAESFGVGLAEAGLLLAANRLVRIAGYGLVARLYARHGDRATCLLAVATAACCSLGYATLSGFWALLPLRLLWGMSFAGLNLSTQALATVDPVGAARRSGRSRAIISSGPVIALPLGALLAYTTGPRTIFFVLAMVALAGLWFASRLPTRGHPVSPRRGFTWPGSLEGWSFLEGFVLDGLFIIGLAVLGRQALPDAAVLVAGALLASRYLGEISLSPLGGSLAERYGAERLLVVLSLVTALALIAFGAGLVWSGAAAVIALRSLQVPLLAPIVARRTPGPERVRALASRAIWRDIGAGLGPIAAGLLLPVAPALAIYGVAAALLAAAALAVGRDSSR